VRELPSYVPAIFVGATGVFALAVFVFSAATILIQQSALSSLTFVSVINAAEIAAWRLKWLAVPATVIFLWIGIRIHALILQSPLRFTGRRIARTGIVSAMLASLMVATFIGITVPERLRVRQLGIRAASDAQLWTLNRALLQYRTRYGTFPSTLKPLRTLPDADGSIAAALALFDQIDYKPTSVQARLPKRLNSLRGAALRNASLSSTNDLPDEGLSFTNFELTLPGADKILGTPDDATMRDGVILDAPPRQTSAIPSVRDVSAP
jgi:type II secretory pathway pseudopilin PulG